ncbi:VapC toxin family PIN domain ribonuclease [Mycobacterium sp. pUA109]|uniref:VapC toxin family PIN domain ribonuclease n=1 Tax=Mycobacterium sp. pUA109 TaxID=3238982 RepID=UPI00351B9DE3
MIAIADTSGLLALFNRADPEHTQTVAAADACGLLVVSPLALVEAHQVASIRADRRAADAILGTVVARAESSRVAIVETTPRLLRNTLAVRRRYVELDLDLADAAAVVLAAEYRTDVVLTLDRRDFRAIRPLTGHGAFRLLPDDL